MSAMRPLPLVFGLALLATAGPPRALGGSRPAAARWGEHGHRLVGEAAARALPPEMPEFFRRAAPQLAFLNPEPDRWRDRAERVLDSALDRSHSPEHYVNLELVPPGALRAADRLAYADSLRAAGRGNAGLLHYRMLELSQRLRVSFRAWRAATDAAERAWLEQRIVDDAGILGHYVADAANPHHTTVHHNGWVGANPHQYPTDDRTHARFERDYVDAHVTLADVQGAMRSPARSHTALREALWAHVRRSHEQLHRLYQLDRAERFGRETAGAEHKRFTAERLAAGAEMLRDVWWTAWGGREVPSNE